MQMTVVGVEEFGKRKKRQINIDGNCILIIVFVIWFSIFPEGRDNEVLLIVQHVIGVGSGKHFFYELMLRCPIQ